MYHVSKLLTYKSRIGTILVGVGYLEDSYPRTNTVKSKQIKSNSETTMFRRET